MREKKEIKSFNLINDKTRNVDSFKENMALLKLNYKLPHLDKIRLKKDYILPLLIFLTITFMTGIPRINIPYTWDDPTAILVVRETAIAGMTDPFKTIMDTAYAIWYDDASIDRGYRPLNSLVVITEIIFWDNDPTVPTLIHSTLLGATALFVYVLIRELTNKKYVAVASAFLTSLTIPALTGTWIVINKQPLVSFFIVLGLLSYVRFMKTRQYRWLAILAISAIIGPFFRELLIILPVVILIHMIVEKKMNKEIIVAIPIFLFHSVFPSFLPNLVLHSKIVLAPITGRFAAWRAIDQDLTYLYQTTTHAVPLKIALFIPLLFTALALIGITIYFMRKRDRIKDHKILAIFLVPLVSLVILAAIINLEPHHIFPILLFLIVTGASFRFNKLLPVWFLVSSLPFFAIYSVDVHLWPASIPWIIMILLWVDDIIIKVKDRISTNVNRRTLVRILYFSALVTIGVGLADHGLNLVAVYSSFSEIANTNKEMGQWFTSNAKEGTIFVTNFIHGLDVEYFTNGYAKNHYQFNVPFFPLSERMLSDRYLFEKAINENYQNNEIYLLAEANNWAPENRISFQHRYLIDPPGVLEFKHHFSMNCLYPFIDPLKNFVPVELWNFPGPPDLHNNVISTVGLFYRECLSDYYLYKLTKYQPTPAIVESYKIYNIVFYDGKYYFIPINEGGFDINKCKPGGYTICLSGTAIENIKQKIDSMVGVQLVDSYKNFNILLYKEKYYAIPQGEGYFDVELVGTDAYSASYTDESINDIKKMIDAHN